MWLELLYSKPFLLCFTTETCMFNLSQRGSERVQFLNLQLVLVRTPRAISHNLKLIALYIYTLCRIFFIEGSFLISLVLIHILETC